MTEKTYSHADKDPANRDKSITINPRNKTYSKTEPEPTTRQALSEHNLLQAIRVI